MTDVATTPLNVIRVYELSDLRYREEGAVSIRELLYGNCSCLNQFYILREEHNSSRRCPIGSISVVSDHLIVIRKRLLSQDIPGKTNNIFAVSKRQNTETCHIK